MNVCSARFARGLHVITFNREDADERARADACYRKMSDEVGARGVFVGRAPVDYHDFHMPYWSGPAGLVLMIQPARHSTAQTSSMLFAITASPRTGQVRRARPAVQPAPTTTIRYETAACSFACQPVPAACIPDFSATRRVSPSQPCCAIRNV